MSGSCSTGPGVAPTAAEATSFPDDDSKRGAAMPVYQFAVRWNDDQASDARWTYLEDVEAARRYAKLLAKESVGTGFYPYFLPFTCGGKRRGRQCVILNSIPRDRPLASKSPASIRSDKG